MHRGGRNQAQISFRTPENQMCATTFARILSDAVDHTKNDDAVQEVECDPTEREWDWRPGIDPVPNPQRDLGLEHVMDRSDWRNSRRRSADVAARAGIAPGAEALWTSPPASCLKDRCGCGEECKRPTRAGRQSIERSKAACAFAPYEKVRCEVAVRGC